jgi:hypothetical protein
MQISKLLPVICAIAVCANFISVRAQDSPAQAAARAALMEKMGEMDAQEASTNAAAPPVTTTPSDATQKQTGQPHAAATTPTPAQEQSAPATTSSNADEQAANRAALMEKMNELNAQQSPSALPIIVTPSGATVVAPPVAAAPAQTNPPAVSTPIETPEPAPTVAEPAMQPVGGEAQTKAATEAQKQAVLAAEEKAADDQAKADEQKAATDAKAQAEAKAKAKRDAKAQKAAAAAKAAAEAKAKAAQEKADKIQKQKMAEADKQRADAEKAAESAASANNIGTELGLKPIDAPALPISAAKEEQLQALLAKYRADQISPAEYQSNRAEILAEP